MQLTFQTVPRMLAVAAPALLSVALGVSLDRPDARRRRSAPVDEQGRRGNPRERSGQRPPPAPAPEDQVVVGYASVPRSAGSGHAEELREQSELIAHACDRLGLTMSELVGEREPKNGKGLDRPGLAYALRRISSREAQGLVVVELSRLTHSVAELGAIIEWFTRSGARLVSADDGLDTDEQSGRLAAQSLVKISTWERERLSERTRKGLQAARENGSSGGRPAVADDLELSKRIVRMRAEGMTLQAIADRLNEEGVPTVRGGVKWRHSSVQAAAGYRRIRRTALASLPHPKEAAEACDSP